MFFFYYIIKVSKEFQIKETQKNLNQIDKRASHIHIVFFILSDLSIFYSDKSYL